MINSQITLYYGTSNNRWQLFEERNFIIDDIEEYLDGKEHITRDGFQYQKIQLDMNIKVDLNQDYALPFKEEAIKYVKITPSNEEKNYYFYVRSCEWISRSAVRLTIHLDTLNTFKYGSYENGYELSGETHISRQHKDRFTGEEVKHSSYKYKTQVLYASINSGIATLWDKLGSPTSDVRLTNLGMKGTFTRNGVVHSFDTTGNFSVLGIEGKVLSQEPYYVYLRHFITGQVEDFYNKGWKPYEIQITGDPSSHTYSAILIISDPNNVEWGYSEPSQIWIKSDELTSSEFPSQESSWSVSSTYNIIIIFSNPNNWGNETSSIQSIGREYGETQCGYEVIEYRDNYDITSESLELVFELDYESDDYYNNISEADITISSLDFEYNGSIYSSGSNNGYVSSENNYLERVIDYYSEALNLPVYNVSEGIVENVDSKTNENWYELYMNQNDLSSSGENPVLLYLVPQTQKIGIYPTSVSSPTISVETITAFFGTEVSPVTFCCSSFFTAHSDTYTTKQYEGIEIDGTSLSSLLGISYNYITTISIKVEIVSAKMDVSVVVYYNYNSSISKTFSGVSSITYSIQENMYVSEGDTFFGDYNPSYSLASWMSFAGTGLFEGKTLAGISEINRTDSRIIKLIELPYIYCPVSIGTGNNLVLPAGAEYDENVSFDQGSSKITLIDISSCELNNTITSDCKNPEMDFLLEDTSFSLDKKFTDELSEGEFPLESKLYHSDFYYKKAVYDSFNFVFPLEKLNPRYDLINTELIFEFSATKTANSTFMFMFDLSWKFAEQDYPNVMVVSRNNQLSLYSSEYLNYVRTGYNYDVKNKNLQVAQDWVSLLGQGGQGGARAGMVSEFNQGAGTYGLVSTGLKVATGFINNILSMSERENSINKKITEKQYETESIYGSDDVDLMERYAQNRLKLVTYDLSPQMKRLVASLFHYTGYACNDYGVPEVDTRLRFNFVQAEIIFDSVLNFSNEIKSDITSKWADGVFFIHHYNDEWDLKLEYENYEKVLEPYLVKE